MYFLVLFQKQWIGEWLTGVNLDHRICFDQCPLLQLLWLDAGLPPLAEDPTVGEQPESRMQLLLIMMTIQTPLTGDTGTRHSQQILGKLGQRSEEVFWRFLNKDM